MIAHGLALAATLLLAGPAPADDPAPPAAPPITLTPEQSAWVCEQRIPRILTRIDELTARIQGDAATPGSVADLRERAAQARDAGRDGPATQLDRRADRRAGRVAQLAGLRDRVAAFDEEHCR